VDEKRVANITQGLPLGLEEADLIVSSYVLEHLEDLEAFIFNSKQTLKRGGYFIHLLPSKFAPFALINQVLPRNVSTSLLSYLCRPGFPAYYDNCYYSAIKVLLEKHDFKLMKTHLSYYQSRYFGFFFPLFIVSAFYEVLLYALRVKNPCAHLLVVARKR
jgi:SAM-dependent methyltransferase